MNKSQKSNLFLTLLIVFTMLFGEPICTDKLTAFSETLITKDGDTPIEARISDYLNEFHWLVMIGERNGEVINPAPQTAQPDTSTMNPSVANPGDELLMYLFYKEETNVIQIDTEPNAVLRFDLPEGFDCQNPYSTYVDIGLNVSGEVVTIPNNPVHFEAGTGPDDPDHLIMTWNFEGIDQSIITTFENTSDVNFYIPVIGTVMQVPIPFP